MAESREVSSSNLIPCPSQHVFTKHIIFPVWMGKQFSAVTGFVVNPSVNSSWILMMLVSIMTSVHMKQMWALPSRAARAAERSRRESMDRVSQDWIPGSTPCHYEI